MISRYVLAPMDSLLFGFTLFCYALPVVMGVAALSTPAPVRPILLGVVGFLVAMYAFVWLWMRPRAFVITADALELEWPVRRRSIPRSAITAVRILDKAQLRAELGTIMRIGAGGLWGGFGFARTARGLHELWVSRVDRMVWIVCEGRKSLLVTPADPERFVAELAPS